jgi:peptide/nickel transport system permease protein
MLAFILGTLFGMLSGIHQSKTFDHFARFFSITSLSFPIFSLGPVLVYFMAIKLKMLPVSEWGSIKHAILPILTLVIPLGAIITKVTRNKYLEESKVPWVEFLRAKGMDDRGINLRVLKICMPTILNIVGIQLSVVLAGTMITETIFDIPGMGMLLFESIQNRDYPVVQGIIVYSTIIYMAIYFTVDFLNEKIDPRIGG